MESTNWSNSLLRRTTWRMDTRSQYEPTTAISLLLDQDSSLNQIYTVINVQRCLVYRKEIREISNNLVVN